MLPSTPFTKLQLFRQVKQYVLGPMNRDEITPVRAGTILEVVEKKILAIKKPEEVTALCIWLSGEFPELAILKKKLDLREDEQMDDLVRGVLEEVVTNGNLTLASSLFDELKSSGDKEELMLPTMQSLCPVELKTVQERMRNA